MRSAVTDEEAQRLSELASGVVLEIGSYYGRSTVALAEHALVHAVDTFRCTGLPGEEGRDVLPTFLANLSLNGVRDRVVVHVGPFRDVLPRLRGPFDLAFVDGHHSREAVRFEVGEALRLARRVAVHDYGRFEVAEGLADLGVDVAEVTHTLALLEE